MKEYDYWLIIWKDRSGEEIHQPAPFQKDIDPKPYCEEVMKSEYTTSNGKKLKNPYSSYSLHRLVIT